MTYEYGEPLGQSPVEGNLIVTSDGCRFAYFVDDSVRHRVIACINACAGISNEDLGIMGLGGVAQILADESPNPQNATLSDIADLLRRILDRMPQREVE